MKKEAQQQMDVALKEVKTVYQRRVLWHARDLVDEEMFELGVILRDVERAWFLYHDQCEAYYNELDLLRGRVDEIRHKYAESHMKSTEHEQGEQTNT
jgi:hypothetical protein